jgi:predicted short-subunit dehydrogenase-like oxidoreductase (DUF2520 family)
MPDPPARPGRFAVGIVGVGRVGSVLGAALARSGHPVVAATAVSAASRRRAAELLPGTPLLAADEVVARSVLVLLTVPDDTLSDLVEGLAATGAFAPGQLVAHTSGRHGLDVLEPAVRRGALPIAIHPAMTFVGSSVDFQRLAGCAFGVTAPEPLVLVAEALVIEMGGEPVRIAAEDRALYHAALAAGSDHLVTLVAETADQLRAAGVAEPARMLGPLLGAALDNALRSGDGALTGPVACGDAAGVAAQLAELRRTTPAAVPAYVALARLTADRALAAGRLDPTAAAALLGVLASPSDGALA